jgi:acetyl esterase
MSGLEGGAPITTIAELREFTAKMAFLVTGELPTVGAVHEAVVLRKQHGTTLTADIIVPEGRAPFPVLVYLHGGGWVLGKPEDYRRLACRFAQAGFLVVNVDYRLAPEAPFPAAYDDCVFAVRWAGEQARRFGGDPTCLVIGGDSAGANLAAAVATTLADDQNAPRIHAALLAYGVFDIKTMPRGETHESGLLVDAIATAYLGADPGPLWRDPRVSPLFAAAKLPPSFVVVGAADSLEAQSAELARALASAGIPHEHVVVEGMPHGFIQMEAFPPALPTINRMAAFALAQLDR